MDRRGFINDAHDTPEMVSVYFLLLLFGTSENYY